jgi:hypothetical protein
MKKHIAALATTIVLIGCGAQSAETTTEADDNNEVEQLINDGCISATDRSVFVSRV